MGRRNNVQLLVKSTEKIRAKLKWPLYIQPKLNGVRALIYKENFDEIPNTLFGDAVGERIVIESSEGNHYELPHLDNALNVIFDKFGVILDGELYIHDEPLNRIIRRLPKTNAKGTVSTPSLPPEDLEFHVFDIKSDKPQRDRLITLNAIREYLTDYEFNLGKTLPIKFVTTHLINDLVTTEQLLNSAIKNGYEGIVLRYPNSLYAAGSKKVGSAIKLKKWHSTECEVIDILSEGMKDNVYVIKFLLKNDINDEQFLCNVGNSESSEHWDNNYKQAVYHNRAQYIGKKVTVKFYERTNPRKLPFHSSVITVRNYE